MQAKPSTVDTGANGQTVEPTALAAASSVGSALSREAHNFLADIEDLARAKAKLAERITAARASVEKMGGAITDGTRRAAQATDGFVHERPWQAIGIGAALGVLLGVLIARRA